MLFYASLALLYGLLGMVVEVFFTAIAEGKVQLAGKTYLWMLPIYSLGGLTLDISNNLELVLLYKLIFFTCEIFVIEYVSGFLLRRYTGICPWDYGNTKFSIHGLIRLDYFIFWFCLSGGWFLVNGKLYAMARTLSQ